MAYYHVDFAKGGDNTTGATWATAYYTFEDVDGVASNGDIIFVKNNTPSYTGSATAYFARATTDPVLILSVLPATSVTGASIAQSDLIPGFRTGGSSRASDHANSPTVVCTDSAFLDYGMRGVTYVYGITMNVNDQIAFTPDDNGTYLQHYEECTFKYGQSGGGRMSMGYRKPGDDGSRARFTKCLFNLGVATTPGFALFTGGCHFEWIDCEFTFPSATTWFDSNDGGGDTAYFRGCDLSDYAHTISMGGRDHHFKFSNCKTHASIVARSGSDDNTVEFINCGADTGLTTGDVVTEYEKSCLTGSIVTDKTSVRTGAGANDGESDWALAFTATAGETTSNYRALVGPWMYAPVAGDGTSKTLTVYINNSTASDFDDHEVWLEVLYPSEGGDDQYDYVTTQRDLLDTTTDTAHLSDDSSSWGGSRTQAQKLQVSIAPDYTGTVQCRVHFAPGTTDTLYVDPLPVIA